MRTDVIVNDITSTVAALGLAPLAAVGTEVIFDLNLLPGMMYHPGIALGGFAIAFVALATKAVSRPYLFSPNPFDRYIDEYTR